MVGAKLLGGFDVVLADGRSAGPWERPAARRLIAYLLLRPGRQAAREEIIESLFANLGPERGSNALSKAMTMARTALREGEPGAPVLLDADRTTVRLQTVIDVDLDTHRQDLRRALDLPPGSDRVTALAEATRERRLLLPEEPYAEWIEPARDELRRLRLEAMLALARESTGPEQLQTWIELSAAEPTNEEACAALLRHFQTTGQRDRAVRTFHRCRAALLSELDVAPSPALLALAAQAGEVDAGASTTRISAGGALPRGREALVQQLLRACDDDRRHRAIGITGPAGIGKTHVVTALIDQLERRAWTVVQATAAPEDRLSPYAGLRAVLGQLDGGAARELLRSMRRDTLVPAGASQEAVRARLAEEIVEALDEAADRSPVAVVLDDAHWSDEAQRAVVGRICRGGPRRWLVVVVARDDEAAARELELPLDAPRFVVVPLPPEAMTQVVLDQDLGLPDAVLHQVVQRSRGNPFFALELGREYAAGGLTEGGAVRVPERIVQLLRARISTCTAPARQLLPLIALAGPQATYELVLAAGAQETLTGSAEECIRALDELSAAHLLVETTIGLRLLHPLLRDAALASINPFRRGALHVVLADAMESRPADRLAIARHRLAAFTAARLSELAPRAAAAGFEAGQLARAVYANDAALELLRGALDAYEVLRSEDADRLRPQAVDAWASITEIHLDDDDPAAATTAAHVAVALAATDDERARAWGKVSGVHYRQGDFDRAAASLESGLATLDGDPVSRARLLSDIGWNRHRAGGRDEARALYQEALPVLESADEPLLLSRCLDRLALSYAVEDGEYAVTLDDRALALAIEAGDEEMTAVVRMHRAEVLGLCGRTAEGLVDLDAAASWFAAGRDHYMQSVIEWVRAKILVQHGDLPAALTAREAEIALLQQVGNASHLVTALLHRAELLARLDRRDDSESAYAEAVAAADESGDVGLIDRARSAGRVREA